MTDISIIVTPFRRTLEWFRGSIHRKFAVAVLPIIVGTIVLILSVDELIHFGHSRGALLERQYQAVEQYSEIFAGLMSNGNQPLIDNLVAAIEAVGRDAMPQVSLT